MAGEQKQAVFGLFFIKFIFKKKKKKAFLKKKRKKSVLIPKRTYIREMNFVARLIKDFNEDIINSASFQDPAFAWLNLES